MTDDAFDKLVTTATEPGPAGEAAEKILFAYVNKLETEATNTSNLGGYHVHQSDYDDLFTLICDAMKDPRWTLADGIDGIRAPLIRSRNYWRFNAIVGWLLVVFATIVLVCK